MTMSSGQLALTASRKLNKRPAPGAVVDFSPDDLLIVQKRQDWRLRVARVCVEYFELCDHQALSSPRKSPGEIAALTARFLRVADYVKAELPSLLVTGVTVHELEAVRYQIHYFLEEIVRHLRANVQKSVKTKSPLQGLTQEEVERQVSDSLRHSDEALLVFIDDVVRLAEFELEVGSQRERIRLLLGSDRRLSNLGNNETIMTAPLPDLWRAFGDFVGVYSYLREHLPPLLEKASPYPELEEELRLADEQLAMLIESRVAPFAQRTTFRGAQDAVLADLEGTLDRGWQRATEILEARVVPLARRTAATRRKHVTAAEVDAVPAALAALCEELRALPESVELPGPATPLDGRGERHGNRLDVLGERLAAVLAQVPLLEGFAADRAAGPELPELAVLDEMLVAADSRLRALQTALEAALAEVQQLREARVRPLREHFCTLLGELRTFLQTSFAHIAAKDPRSTESSYHFFLREFSSEAHQAIVLLKEIRDLEVFITSLECFTVAGLPLNPENLARILRVLFVEKEEEKKRIPSGEGWKVVSVFLEKLRTELVPRLQRVCALDGIRFEDKHFLSEWAMDLARNCTLCLAQHETGYGLIQEMGRLRGEAEHSASRQSYAHIVTARTCRAMQRSLTEICMTLTASIPYVSIMRGGVERRASIFFHRQQKILENAHLEAALLETAPEAAAAELAAGDAKEL
jgi:hypothetical protein